MGPRVHDMELKDIVHLILEIKAGAFSFAGFENLLGGTASDTFKFSPAGAISGSINGGGGGDWLDYSLFTTPVSVNLATGAATRVAGAASGKVAGIQNVVGGNGNSPWQSCRAPHA